jgi:hypothetical protein
MVRRFSAADRSWKKRRRRASAQVQRKRWNSTIASRQPLAVGPADTWSGTLDRRELARSILTAMAGGVMQARTHRDPAYFASSVRQLRIHFDHLEREAAQQPSRTRSPRRKSTSRGNK